MKRSLAVFMATLLLGFAPSVGAAEEEPPPVQCKMDSRITGPCFRAHGMLLNTANRGTALIVSGWSREFNIVGETYPEILGRIFEDFQARVYGVYEICPFHSDQAVNGFRHYGCIESVDDIIVDPAHPEAICDFVKCM